MLSLSIVVVFLLVAATLSPPKVMVLRAFALGLEMIRVGDLRSVLRTGDVRDCVCRADEALELEFSPPFSLLLLSVAICSGETLALLLMIPIVLALPT